MKNRKKLLVLLITACILCLFNNCNNSSSKSDNQVVLQDSIKADDTIFSYEPHVYSFTGTLNYVMFYGPPGFGEDTANDAKEWDYILELDKPISILADSGNDFNDAKSNIQELQILTDTDLKQQIHQKVTLTGTLFGAQTAHHHTEVLLDARKLVSETVTFSIDTFSVIPPDVLGTYCYYSRNKKEFEKDEWIFIDANDNLAYMKINGALTEFKLLKTESVTNNKSIQQYQSDNYDLIIEFENKNRSGEMLKRFGTIKVTSKQGTIITSYFYGGCGS